MLRRDFLRRSSLIVGFAARGIGFAAGPQSKSILEFGAKPDGRTLNTDSIQRTIDTVAQAGGGTVHVPAGAFLTGRIDLKSRVTLYLDEGSTLLGSTSLSDYQGNPQNGKSNERHLIFATDAEDVTLAGPGRLDGQGASFWEPSGKTPLPPGQEWADVAARAWTEKKSGRPSPMLHFVNCRRLHVEGVHIENSPGWTLRVTNSDDVSIHGVSIRNPIYGPNTDGIDITGCQGVLISDCTIETGDDAICFKSENPYGSEPRLIKNVTVTNCLLNTCCNGFKLGTSSEGGFENITFSNSKIYSDPGEFKNRVISGVALEVVDGGWIDGVQVNGIEMQRTRTPIFIRLGNRKRVHDYQQHGIRNVDIDGIHATEALLASSITGLPGMEVRNITLSNVQAENVFPSRPDWVGHPVPEKESTYPEARMFGMLPASCLYVRHARGLHFNDLAFRSTRGELRPTVIFDDVAFTSISGLTSTRVEGHMPVVQLSHCHDVSISRSVAPKETEAFVGVDGSNSAKIELLGNDVHGARTPVELSGDAPSDAVIVSANSPADRN